MKRFDLALKLGVGVVCAYEAVAIAVNQATGGANPPTVSREVGAHWWIGPIVLVALGAHFYWPHLVALTRKGKK